MEKHQHTRDKSILMRNFTINTHTLSWSLNACFCVFLSAVMSDLHTSLHHHHGPQTRHTLTSAVMKTSTCSQHCSEINRYTDDSSEDKHAIAALDAAVNMLTWEGQSHRMRKVTYLYITHKTNDRTSVTLHGMMGIYSDAVPLRAAENETACVCIYSMCVCVSACRIRGKLHRWQNTHTHTLPPSQSQQRATHTHTPPVTWSLFGSTCTFTNATR